MTDITSKDNKNIKHITKLIESAKYRKECNEFFVEGKRLCVDSLKSNAIITMLLFTSIALEKYNEEVVALQQKAQQCFLITQEIATKISDTTNSQGIFCICKMVDNSEKLQNISHENKIIALEKIQDPSNLGTIFRTAEAFGLDAVFLTSDCCDSFSPKVVRGSMGAIFRLPIFIMKDSEEIIRFLKQKQIKSYGAVVYNNAEKITQLPEINKGNIAIWVGNEGNGLCDTTVSLCDKLITIPMNGRAESLNASTASSILMWEMVR